MNRFIDRKDLHELIKQSPDFKERYYGSVMKLVSILIMVVAVVSATTTNIFMDGMYIDFDVVKQSKILKIILLLVVVEVVVVGYLYTVICNLRKALTAIDFQVTLFAGAMRTNTVFYIIANADKKIVYADKGATEIFSAKSLESMDALLKNDLMSEETKKKLKHVMKSNEADECKLTYKEDNKKKTCKVLLAPMDKPKGFFCIKGIK